MRFLEGYLADNLELFPVDVLEDVLLRIRRDLYLNDEAKETLMKIYIEERRWKLCKQFACTKEDLKRIAEMNDLLTRQTLEVAQLGWNLYQEHLELKRSGSKAYRPVKIELRLSVPESLYFTDKAEKERVYTEKEADIWDVLMKWHQVNRMCDILPHSYSLYTEPSYEEEQSLELLQQQLLWGTEQPEEDSAKRSWANVMTGIDREKLKHICVIWPFHNLFDFCGMAMQDILKIDKFNMNIKLEYDEI